MKSPKSASSASLRTRFAIPAAVVAPAVLSGPIYPSAASRPRFVLPALALFAGMVILATTPSARGAADTVNAVKASPPTTTTAGYGDLSVGANYTTTTIVPTAATTTDVNFAASTTYSVTTFDANGTALSFGSLDDLDATQTLTLTNSNATAATLALNLAGTNATSGANTADLLYVAAGANLSIASGSAGGLTLLLTNTGSIDDAGTLSLGTPITITSGKTVTFSGFGTTTVSGAIGQTGSSSIAITDTGKTIFSGANTYTGTTTLTAGVLNAGIGDTGTGATATAGALGAGGQITFGGGTLQYSAASAGTDYSGRIKSSTAGAINLDTNGQKVTFATSLANTNTGGLTLSDTNSTKGSLTLSTSNAYTGTTNLNSGTLFANAATALSTSAVNINPGATLATLATGGANLGGGAIALNNGTIQVGNATVNAVSASLPGVLTFTGATTINLQNSSGSTAALTLGGATTGLVRNTNNAATLILNGATALNGTTDALTVTNYATGGGATAAGILTNGILPTYEVGTAAGSANADFLTSVAGGANGTSIAGSAIKVYSAYTVKAAAAAQAFGSTTVYELQNGASTITSGQTAYGIKFDSGAILNLGTQTLSIGGSSGSLGGIIFNGTGDSITGGTLRGNNNDGEVDIYTANAATISSNLTSGSGAGAFTFFGPGTLTLSGASVTSTNSNGVLAFNGNVTDNLTTGFVTSTGAPFIVNNGTLTLKNNNGLNGTAGVTLTLNSPGTVDLGGSSQTLYRLIGGSSATVPGGTLTSGTAGAVLTLNNAANNNNDTFYGNITSANLALTKLGTNTETLSGLANYTGTTTVNSGQLTFAPVVAGVNDSLGTLSFAQGAGTVQSTYQGTGTTTLTFANLAARTPGASGSFLTTNGTNGTTNSIVLTQFNGAAPVAKTLLDPGYFFGGSGYATVDSTGFLRGYASTDVNAATAAAGTNTIVSNAASNVFASSVSGQTTASVNTLNLGGGNSLSLATGATFSTNGIIGSGLGGVNSGNLTTTASGGELVVRWFGNNQIVITSAVTDNNTSSFTDAGGSVYLNSSLSTYKGATTVDGGTLFLGGDTTGKSTAAGSLGASSGVVLNTSGNLSFYLSTPYSFTNPITTGTLASGSTITQAGTGTLALGSITNSGNTSALAIVRNATGNVGGTVGPTGAFNLGTLNGNLTLTDNSTAGTTVPTTVTQTGTGLTISTISGASGSVVNLGGAGSTTIANTLNSAGQLVDVTAGTVTLSSAETTATNVEVDGGALIINNTRFSTATNNETLKITGGTFQVNSNSTYGLRLNGDNGAVGAGTATTFTGTQTGGTLLILQGGANTGFSLGSTTAGASSTYTLSGGILSALVAGNNGYFNLGADTTGASTTTFNLSGGTLLVNNSISGDQASAAKQAFVWTGGTLTTAQFYAANLTSTSGAAYAGNVGTLTNAGGTLAPGFLATSALTGTGYTAGTQYTGKTTITGNYAVTSGSANLAINLGGTTASGGFGTAASLYDNVAVSGTASLGGTLSLSVINGFTLTSTSSFTILTAGNGVSGTFTNAPTSGTSAVVVANDPFSGKLVVTYNTGNVTLGGYIVNQWQGPGNWGSGGASVWTDSVDPNGIGAGAAFESAGASNNNLALDQNRTVGQMLFSSANYTIGAGGGTLTLDNTGLAAPASITLLDNHAATIAAPITLNSDLAFTGFAGGSLTLSGTLSGGTHNITTSTAGTLVLSGADTYGNTTIGTGSTLQVGNGGATGNLGSGTITDNGTLAFNNTGYTLATAITGTAGGVTQMAGSTTLNGVNTYTGATSVPAGTLTIGTTGVIGSGGGTAITVSGGTLVDNSTVATTGGITGTSSLTVSSGSATLNGLNNYTGTTRASGGTLTIGTAGVIGSGGGTAITVSGGTLVDNSTVATTGGITGTSSLSVSASGSATLNGLNTYTGATSVPAGTLTIGTAGVIGSGGGTAITVNGGTLADNSTVATTGGITGTSSLAVSASGSATLNGLNNYTGATGVSSGTLTIGTAGVIGSGGGTAITVNGGTLADNSTVATTGGITGTSSLTVSSGAATLSGANNYSGATTLSGTGTLNVNSAGAIGTSTFTINAGTLNNNASALTINMISNASTSTVNLAGTGTASITNILTSPSQTVNFNSGTINLNGSGAFTSTMVVNGATVNTKSDAGNGSNFQQVPNLQVLAGTLNFQENTGIRAGTNYGPGNSGTNNAADVLSGGAIVFSNSSGLYLGGNGTSAFVDTFALSGTGIYNGSAAGSVLQLDAPTSGVGYSTFNFSGGTLLLNGTIKGSRTAAGEYFVWTGGTLATSAYDATFLSSTQGTAVSASTNTLTNGGGILAPGNVGTAGKTTITGNYSVTSANAAYAVDIGGINQGNTFQNTAANASYDFTSVSGTTVLGGRLNFNLINSYTPANNTTTLYTVLQGATAASSTVTGTFTNQVAAKSGNSRVVGADGVTSFLLAINNMATAATTGGLTSVPARGVSLGGYQTTNTYSAASGNAWDAANAADWTNFDPGATATPATQASGAIAQFADNAGTGTGANTVTLNNTRNIQGIQFSSATTGHNYTINDAGSGTGKIILDNTANSAAATIADSSVAGNANAVNLPITLNSALAVSVTNATNTLTLGGVLSGAQSLTKSGLGTLILSNANTYSGTTINAGALDVTGSGTLGATSGALALSGGLLDLGTTSQTVGAVTITAAPATGNTIQNGSLTGTSYAASNTTGTAIVNANLLGSGALTKTGLGTLVLGGTNTYSGTTTLGVNAGNIEITNASALGTGSVALTTTNAQTSASTLQIALTGGTLAAPNVIANNFTGNSQNPLTGGTAGTANIENVSGFNELTGTYTLTGTGGTGQNVVADAGSTLQLAGALTITGPLGTRGFDFGGAGNILLSGVYSPGTATGSQLQKDGTGTLTVTAANTYTGSTIINGGILQVQGTETPGTSGPLGNGGTITFGGGTLQYSSTNAADYSSRFSTVATQAYKVDTNGQAVTYATGLMGAGTSTLSVGSTAPGGQLNLTGLSTYTGATTVGANAVLNLASAGTNAGAAANGSGNYVAGTLSGATPITVNNGGTLLLSASYAVNPASNVTVNGTGTAVTGTGAINLASGVLIGQGAHDTAGMSPVTEVYGMTMQGVGMLTLSSNATLYYGGSSGTLVFNSFTPNGNTLDIEGASLNFADPSSFSGVDGVNDRLIFLTDPNATGLLANITFNGVADATEINLGPGNGFEVIAAVPEPSTWIAGVLTVLAVVGIKLRRRKAARV